jgi:ABC-type transport system involved in cytochrome c biogenesis permease subunit
LPDQETVDRLSGRFVVAGFLFWGIMIASGAIWANEAWGRYWAWDPIETWSLVVWIIYAVYLHLRLTLGWRGEKIAWYAIIAMPVAMFCLAGIPFLYKASIHTGYLAS